MCFLYLIFFILYIPVNNIYLSQSIIVAAIKIEYIDRRRIIPRRKGTDGMLKRLNTTTGIRDCGALRPLKAAGPLPPHEHKSREGSPRIVRSRDGYTVNLSDASFSLSLS